MKLWYKQPANPQIYTEGLPIGNGKLGAMFAGSVVNDNIVLNQDSVWHGGPHNRVNPDAKKSIPEIRKLIFDGKPWQAEKTAFMTMTSTPETERNYQIMGNVIFQYYYHEGMNEGLSFLDDKYIQQNETVKFLDYKRELNLENATTSLQYRVGKTLYKREAFASYPDGIIAIKISSDKKAKCSFTVRVTRDKTIDYCGRKNNNIIYTGGNMGKDGVDFAFGITAVANGGKTYILGQHLIVEQADSVWLYIFGTTTFYHQKTREYVINKLSECNSFNYDDIRLRHIKDYQSIFNNVKFSINNSDTIEDTIPTDERLDNVKNGNSDIYLDCIFYQYNRYLQISSSRKGSLPMNLRGIWNHEVRPPWDSKFTININQEMLYWPSDMCGMSECAEPLYHLIKRMQPNGEKVASEMYGCKGFVAHHNTDLWADCAPQDIHRAAFWPMGAAWLVLHLWDSYDYNRDIDILKEYYPIMEDAALFVLDYLVKDPDGYLGTCPSHSPENGYYLNNRKDIKPSITYSPTMDTMITRYLFRRILQSSEILNIDDEITKRIKLVIKKLRPVKIGKYGQIMEWAKDYEEPEPGHRHMAHLFALHPADDISLFKTPELAQAAKISIARRLANQNPEDGKNGWTLAWMMLFEDRLCEPEKAYNYLHNMFCKGVAKNLFGLCVNDKIYVLDGNLGMLTAMTEMIVQSQSNEIFLLPALPTAWSSGKITGIKARGGFVVNVEWNKGILMNAEVFSKTNTVCYLRTKTPVSVFCNKKQQSVQFIEQTKNTYKINFKVMENSTYKIIPNI